MGDIEEFDKILQQLHSLKPPGVSGSRIKAINNIAVKNVAHESVLITKLYSACKACPISNKLGMLYVVDIILRSYNEEAKKLHQPINHDSPDGTFASGIFKINELIESILDDALKFTIDKLTINKILKLIEVWERSKSFDPQFISHLKTKYFKSTTPPGSPPPRIKELNFKLEIEKKSELNHNLSNTSDKSNILLALDNLHKLSSNSPTPVVASATVGNNANTNANTNANNILSQLSNLSNNVVSNAAPSAAPSTSSTASNNVLNMLLSFQNQPSSTSTTATNDRSDRNDRSAYSRRDRSPHRNDNPIRERSPPRPITKRPLPASLPAIPKSLPAIPRKAPSPQQQYSEPSQPSYQSSNQPSNFPPQGLTQPSIQSQPTIDVNGFEEFNIESNPHYRPRNIGIDQTIPNGSIKVFSRTLFFGGVTRDMTQQTFIEILKPFGEVQSIILNVEKKHAFVKVYSRLEAETIINSFNQDQSLPLRIRWGVGFGPRDCCNYQHGISIIPITRLTDSDKLWIENAQWGGTGGQPITSGLVIDEPDIEASTGVSSKSMSKKMPTNSTRNGPKSGVNPEIDYNNNFNNNNFNNNNVNHNNNSFNNNNMQGNYDTNNYQNNGVSALQNLFNQQQTMSSNGIPPSSGNPNLTALSNLFNQQK